MTYPKIELPAEIAGLSLIASVSGGKDSTALMLALREAGLPFRAVFADTGWEAPETYAYLDLLREKIGPIDVVGVEGGMRAKVAERHGFPAGKQRWCTRKLKVEPLRAYHDAIGDDTVNVVGIRGSESAERARLGVLVDEPERDATGHPAWGGWVWRPLMAWTIMDVLRIHNAHTLQVNPLYRAGFDRVGCYPCIYSNKSEIALLAERSPGRIDEIAEMERAVNVARYAANAETPGRFTETEATFFRTTAGVGIRDVATWSRTSRGGRQLPLLAEPPRGGCMRWGLCDLPAEKAESDVDAVTPTNEGEA